MLRTTLELSLHAKTWVMMQIREVLKTTFNEWYRWKFDTFIISCFTFNRKIGSLKREHQNNRSIILFKNNYNFTQELHSLWLFLLQIQPMHNIETWSKLHSAMNTFYDNPNNLISVDKLTFQGAKPGRGLNVSAKTLAINREPKMCSTRLFKSMQA